MKILYVTTVGTTMNFFYEHFKMLIDEGNEIELAYGLEKPLSEKIRQFGFRENIISFSRSPLSINNLKAYFQLKKLIESRKYDIVHCHTPNAAVITRLACRKQRVQRGLKVFYTAHGFHFYVGAPKLNWLIFFPIEKLCSQYTDKIITINQEDYNLAKSKFYTKEIHYVPGVGIDLTRFKNVNVDKSEKRMEIGVPDNAFLLLSVGELNRNKNHEVIIKALSKLKNKNIHYAIAGIGNKKDYLVKLSEDLGLKSQVHFLGYRKDIPELNYVSDAFCLPSYREGLGLAAIEAMACGLPIITSNVHGINDYSVDGVTGYKCNPDDVEGFIQAIKQISDKNELIEQFSMNNQKLVQKYDIREIIDRMREIYE